jgi:MFS family permease
VAFVAVSASLLAFYLAAGAPTPLFPIYESDWGFAPSLLTIAFGVYAFALIVALLVAGGLSDYIGRRPMLIGALVLELAAMVVFLFAPSIGWIIAARVLQGLATGIASSTFGAAIVELASERHKKLGALMASLMTTAGLGIGAVFAGLVALAVPGAATTTVWLVLIVVMVLGTAFALLTPETSDSRPGALGSLVPRLAVPTGVRRLFAATTPSLVAGFLATGFFLGLLPTVLHSGFAITVPIIGGVLNFVMFTAATGVAAVGGRVQPHRLKVYGNIGLLVGGLFLVASVATDEIWLVWAAAVIAGAGMGAAFSGSLRGLIGEVRPHERAGLLAAVFTVSYLVLGGAIIGAGFLVGVIGAVDMAVGYGVVLVLVALLGIVLSVRVVTQARTASAMGRAA